MNPERLQLKGLLAQSRKSLRALDAEASGQMFVIRSILNPYEEILNIDTEKALVCLNRLNDIKNEMSALSEKIKKLESELE